MMIWLISLPLRQWKKLYFTDEKQVREANIEINEKLTAVMKRIIQNGLVFLESYISIPEEDCL